MHSIEGFDSKPEGYEAGKTKFIIITGSVISGVGKGVISASIGRLFESAGLKVFPFKFDGYLNINAGSLNPFRHGEVFILEDGSMCDMDLGTYERFLNTNLSKNNYLTAGQLFQYILDKEKNGGYNGRDVQFIPHVTGEIKKLLRERSKGFDVMLVEVGGTVGDIENSYFIEAIRELVIEEGSNNVLVINVTYVIEPTSLNEQKSKAAQLGIKQLMKQGLKPDIIIIRSTNPVTDSIKEKISVYSSTPLRNVFGLHDLKLVYESPLILEAQGFFEVVKERFSIKSEPDMSDWKDFVHKSLNPKHEIKVMIAGECTNVSDGYASIIEALIHAGASNDLNVNYELIDTTRHDCDAVKEKMSGFNGLILPDDFSSHYDAGWTELIRAARESGKPFLGLSYGTQLVINEFARNVCGLKKVKESSVIINESGACKTILKEGSFAQSIYNDSVIIERYRQQYEVDAGLVKSLESNGLVFSGGFNIIELSNHPFFIATQFHPELTSKPLKPNPLFNGFVKACLDNAE